MRLPTDGSNTLRFRVRDDNQKRHVFRGVEELIDKQPLCVRADLGLPAAVLKVIAVSNQIQIKFILP